MTDKGRWLSATSSPPAVSWFREEDATAAPALAPSATPLHSLLLGPSVPPVPHEKPGKYDKRLKRTALHLAPTQAELDGTEENNSRLPEAQSKVTAQCPPWSRALEDGW